VIFAICETLVVAITFTRQAIKELAGIQPVRAARIREAIERVHGAPRAKHNNVKPLVGVKNGYRLRVGDWRVSFLLEGGDMNVVEIAARGSAYR
jgi:mRNA interferase RelE/StbE